MGRDLEERSNQRNWGGSSKNRLVDELKRRPKGEGEAPKKCKLEGTLRAKNVQSGSKRNQAGRAAFATGKESCSHDNVRAAQKSIWSFRTTQG